VFGLPSVREYTTRKERAILDIQRGIEEMAERNERAIDEIQRGIAEKTEDIATGVREIEGRMEKFKKAWYG